MNIVKIIKYFGGSMKQIRINGGYPLEGTIKISGAKNSAVALIPASILADDVVKIDNIPNISDIDALCDILKYLGAGIKLEDGLIEIDPTTIENKNIPETISSKLSLCQLCLVNINTLRCIFQEVVR